MSETTHFFSLWQAWRYYLLLYVADVSAYISRAVGRVGQSLEMMVGCRSGLVRTNSGSEGYRVENLGPIPPLVCWGVGVGIRLTFAFMPK